MVTNINFIVKKNIEQKLLKKNTNPTSMRILVYDFLEEQQIAMSLSEIESHFYKADRITIYRTLKTFEEKGIVHSIRDNNTSKYILCDHGCDEKTHKDWHQDWSKKEKPRTNGLKTNPNTAKYRYRKKKWKSITLS